MFELSLNDIHPGAQAENKEQAIRQAADALTQACCVSDSYLAGMLERETQTSTFLGNGIAIPHGTTATRHLVQNTGVQVFQYPQGIDWGEGQTAYVVIGIAARSDEHLALLRQLTHMLSDESLAARLAKTDSAEELRSVLMGEQQHAAFLFDSSTLILDIAAGDLMTLKALNAGLRQRLGAVDTRFVSDVIASPPLHLGQRVWLDDSPQGNIISAVAISRPATSFQQDGVPVMMLMTVAMAEEQPLPVLDYLAALLRQQRADRLANADAAGGADQRDAGTGESADRRIRGAQQTWAACPAGTALVSVIKQFDSAVTVTNLDGSGKPANGCSLMKVVALGVKKGHKLRFTTEGNDAEQALQAIGEAIASDLGEGEA